MDAVALTQDILDTHHALLHRELPRLNQVFSRGDLPAKLAEPWAKLHRLLSDHLAKEELILFPSVRALATTGSSDGCAPDGPIMQLHVEHRQIAALSDQIRAASSYAGPDRDALLRLLDDLHTHAAKEDEQLFPAALALMEETRALLGALDRAESWHGTLRATIRTLDTAFTAWEVSPRLAAPWRHFTEGIDDHLSVEEQTLFPAIRLLALLQSPGSTDYERPLEEMQFEIDELNTICDALRSAAPEARHLEGALLEMLDQLEVHADKEASLIFPAAQRFHLRWQQVNRPVELEPIAPKAAPRPAPEVTPMGDARGPTEHPSVLFRVFRRVARALR